MRIVVDTNVLISGVFFGGFPRQILNAVVESRLTACATTEIIDEYEEIVQEMIDRKQGHINRQLLAPLVQATMDQNYFCVVGNEDTLTAAADMFDELYNLYE